jgi:hypothetical protein
VDAHPLLARIAAALAAARLEAIVIGNAGAALQGAPVTTLDVDFMFRRTPATLRKLKKVATALGATVFQPYYPTSSMLRLMNEDANIQLDFLAVVHGVRSFESLRSRAHTFEIEGHTLLVADLADILKSKRAAARSRDIAVLPVLEKTLHERAKKGKR